MARSRAAVVEREMPDFAKALAPDHATPVALPAGLEDGELVVAINRGVHPLTIMWANKGYVLTPDKNVRIPFEAACLWFGDPRSGALSRSVKRESGEVVFLPDRRGEVIRLRLKYGNLFGDERGFENVPDVRVETMDGEEIPTVLQYPDGIPTMDMPQHTDIEALKVQLLRQQNTMNRLMGELAKAGIDLEPGTRSEVEDGGEPDDLPADTDEP